MEKKGGRAILKPGSDGEKPVELEYLDNSDYNVAPPFTTNFAYVATATDLVPQTNGHPEMLCRQTVYANDKLDRMKYLFTSELRCY